MSPCACFLLWCFFFVFLVVVVVCVLSLAPLDAAMPELGFDVSLVLEPEPVVPCVLPLTLPLAPELSEGGVAPVEPMLPVEPEVPVVPMLPLEVELPLVPVLPLPVLPDCANAGTANARTPIRIALPILFPPWSLTLLPAGNIAIRTTA